MIRRRRLDERGIASLIAVTLASLVILLITTAMTGLMIGELRQSIDAENSIVAYYKAQSGAEEALLYVKNYVSDQTRALQNLNQNCDKGIPISVGSPSTTFDPNVTCYSIRTSSSTIASDLPSDTSAQYNLTGITGIAYLKIEWDTTPTKPTDDFDAGHTNNMNADPGAWRGPPPIEVTAIAFPPGNTVTPDSIKTQAVTLVPCREGAAQYAIAGGFGNCKTTAFNIYDFYTDTSLTKPIACKPAAPGSYRCSADIYNPRLRIGAVDSNDSVIRIRPRITGTSYRISAYDGSGNPLDIPLQKAQVDITAKSGDSYRRVVHEIQIRSGIANGDVLFGDARACKDFQQFSAGGGYLNVVQNNCPLENSGD